MKGNEVVQGTEGENFECIGYICALMRALTVIFGAKVGHEAGNKRDGRRRSSVSLSLPSCASIENMQRRYGLGPSPC